MKLLKLLFCVLCLLCIVGCGMGGISSHPVQEHDFLGKLFERSFNAASASSATSEDLHQRITRLRFESVMNKGLTSEKSGELSLIREELLKRNPGWSSTVKTSVRNGKVVQGMTPDQVRAAFGEPTFKYSMDENSLNRPNIDQRAKDYWKGKTMDTWAWKGDTRGYVSGHIRHYEEYSFGTVVFMNGAANQISMTK